MRGGVPTECRCEESHFVCRAAFTTSVLRPCSGRGQATTVTVPIDHHIPVRQPVATPIAGWNQYRQDRGVRLPLQAGSSCAAVRRKASCWCRRAASRSRSPGQHTRQSKFTAAIHGGRASPQLIRPQRQRTKSSSSTPGRVMNNHKKNTLDLSGVTNLIVDEADGSADGVR
jgi:hypothetical protein